MFDEIDNLDSKEKLYKYNIDFQKELQEILILLLKENSLHVLANEILERSVKMCNGVFGIIFYNNNENNFNYISFDPNNYTENIDDNEQEIKANLSFLNKWLITNNKTLIATDKKNNIGFSLNNYLQTSSLLISPCNFDNKLLATLIIGRKENVFNQYESSTSGLFASLLAFAISSINSRNLNAVLQNKLLQAQKFETIGKLSSGMAHDFNNLLSGIFGSVDLLKRRLPDNPKTSRLIDNIEKCSVRARDLTKGLLSYGKPTPKRKEVIKPYDLIQELLKITNSTFPKGIKIESNVEDKLYDILGNSVELYQVLLNLCVNAKEAIGKNGIISVSVKNISVDKQNRSEFNKLDLGNFLWISVKDSGSGIEEENLLRIFEPYFSTKQKETGSGLGLYVSYGIIKALNGEVIVSSEKNKGTTFDVFLPAYEPNKVVSKVNKEKIILLADDEPMLKELLSDLLESYGYYVISVDNGLEALRILKEEVIVDIAILDYSMPDLDGLTCAQKIRELGLQMPIVLSSGSLAFEKDLKWKEKGVNRILTKPYEFNTMFSLIEELI